MPVWISNSRLPRRLSDILGNQAERLAFAVSKLISVVVPVDLIAYEPQTIAIPATAGNVQVTISPTRGHRLVHLYGRFTLVCDATVGNRQIEVGISNSGGTSLCSFGQTNNITASQTKTLNTVEHTGAIS